MFEFEIELRIVLYNTSVEGANNVINNCEQASNHKSSFHLYV